MSRLLALTLVALLAQPALGDAGLVRAHVTDDHLSMTVFTSPTPVRVGPIDLSVLLQSPTDDALRWGDIDAMLTPPDGNAMTIPLTRDTATTAFMQAAKFTVAQEGLWHIDIVARSDGHRLRTAFDIQVAAALPRLLDLWPWFLPIPIVLTLWSLTRRR